GVLRTDLHQRLDTLAPLRCGLLGQPHHEIETEVGNPGIPGFGQRRSRPGHRVHASKSGELLASEGLDTEADAVDTCAAEAMHPGIRRGFWIRFERHLSARLDVEGLPARIEELPDFFRLQERRSAATEEDGVDRLSATRPPNLMLQRAEVA